MILSVAEKIILGISLQKKLLLFKSISFVVLFVGVLSKIYLATKSSGRQSRKGNKRV